MPEFPPVTIAYFPTKEVPLGTSQAAPLKQALSANRTKITATDMPMLGRFDRRSSVTIEDRFYRLEGANNSYISQKLNIQLQDLYHNHLISFRLKIGFHLQWMSYVQYLLNDYQNTKGPLMKRYGNGLIALVFFMSIVPYNNAAGTISPLRLGDDVSDNYITILYSQSGYYLFLKTAFQYLYSEASFCFRLRPVADIDDSTCELTNTTGNYDCLAYNFTSGYITKWVLSSDYTTISNKVSFFSIQAKFGSAISTVGIPLQGTDSTTGTPYSLLGKSNAIFQMVSAPSYTLYQNSNIKYNFVNTFYDSLYFNGTYSDNLIVQRQYQCFRYGKNYDLLFLGGVIHNSAQTYIISFINWNSEKTTFQMWEGLSYSKDHASRDMVGVEPSTGTVTDLFSLYASAPYSDQSINVEGDQSYTTIISTGLNDGGQPTWFYLTTIYRKYDTGDTAGDEVIRFKINNQYCFAAYYDFGLLDIPNSDVPLYTSKSFNHQTLQCFTPDLTLASSFTNTNFVAAAIMAIIVIFT